MINKLYSQNWIANKISILVLIFISAYGCNYKNLDSKNWPPIVLKGTINMEKQVYKLGDTLVFSFPVPDSLPSLTTAGEKVKIHNVNEASLLFNFNELDTAKKFILPLNNNIIVRAKKGNIRVANNTYYLGDFDISNKPFGLEFIIVLNKRGLFSINNGDIRNFVANDGRYKAGLFFSLATTSQNFHLVAKHLPHVSENNPDLSFSYAFYVQ